MNLVIGIKRNKETIGEMYQLGYLSTDDILCFVDDLTDRKLRWWMLAGVFGPPVSPGSGRMTLWHYTLVPILKTIINISEGFDLQNYGNTGLYERIVSNYDKGELVLGGGVKVIWPV